GPQPRGPGACAQDMVLKAPPGDAQLLHADGITEGRSAERGPLLGEDRLVTALTVTADVLGHLSRPAADHARGYAGDITPPSFSSESSPKAELSQVHTPRVKGQRR
ncbi:hypothetical protein ACFWU3_32685, partial [Streptomyces sp. NPDC058685]|uniref:hypothetical protein n=1 Tax=Streptomyces sp. NPDC058685 TaxID=3346598 RepID=UPI0036638A52